MAEKMKLKKEYIVLGSVFLLLVFYLVFRNTNQQYYKLPKLKKINIEKINRIIINRPDFSLNFTKEDNQWFIMTNHFRASQDNIKKMIDVLTNITITDLVSESKNYLLYELDDERKTTVQVFDTDKKLIEIDIGKPAQTYRHTFVKLEGRDEVYHARDNFAETFKVGINQMREKNVMKFDNLLVTKVKVTTSQGSINIAKGTEQVQIPSSGTNENEPPQFETKEIWKTDKDNLVEENNFNDILNTLSDVQCERYLDANKAGGEFRETLYTVEVEADKTYTFNIFKKIDENKYICSSSESDYYFEIASWRADRIMQPLSALVQK